MSEGGYLRATGAVAEADLTPARQGVPESPVRLREGDLACMSCGIAVGVDEASSEGVVEVEAYGRVGEPAAPPGRQPTLTSFTRRRGCAALRRRAEDAIGERPRVTMRIGDQDVAVHASSAPWWS